MSIETLIKELKLYKKSGGVWMQISEEQIEKIIKEFQSEEWISVEDRLPESEDEFLIFPSAKYFGMIATFWPYDDFRDHVKNTFERESEDGTVFQLAVTHWMHLPKPPEVK